MSVPTIMAKNPRICLKVSLSSIFLNPSFLNSVGKKARRILVGAHIVRISNALNLSALLRLGVCLDNARPVAVKTPEQLTHHVSLCHALKDA